MTIIYREVLRSVFKNPRQLPRLFFNGLSIYKSSSIAYDLPVRLHLEQTTYCNLSCRMCPRTLLKRPKGTLAFTKFKKIYDQIRPSFLNLTGLGESFINPDIFKMINYAGNNGCYTKIDTNGILVNKVVSRKVLKSKLNVLSFSIDATDRQTYKKIRRADKFELVITNLKSFVQRRNQEKSNLKIHVAIVVQKDNLHQLIKFIKMMDGIGVDRVTSMYILELGVSQNKKRQLDQYRQKLKQIIKQYYEIKDKLHIEVDTLPLEEFAYKKTNTTNKKGACFIPWHSTFITWNGDVKPCPVYYDNQIQLGNIFEQDFEKIWNSHGYQNFRRKLVHNRKALPICEGCEINENYILEKINLLKKIPFLKSLSQRP